MKVLVAYSGGLDTSVIVKWVKETYNCEVVAYCADVGQEEETDGLDEKARKTGALKCIVDDLNEEFAQDFIFPMMQANAIYEGTYLLGTSIARPLIGKRLVEVAREEGCDAICHGATGKGNDQVRFELAAYALDPKVKIIAAWRDPNWPFKARTEMIEYANNPTYLANFPNFWVPAGACITAAILAFNFVGDGLRDAFDPKMKR